MLKVRRGSAERKQSIGELLERQIGIGGVECLDGSPGKALAAMARTDDRPGDRGDRIAVAAEACRKATDEPRIVRRHRADGDRRRHRLLRSNASADQAIDEVERILRRVRPFTKSIAQAMRVATSAPA